MSTLVTVKLSKDVTFVMGPNSFPSDYSQENQTVLKAFPENILNPYWVEKDQPANRI